MIVVDASALIEVLLQSAGAPRIAERLFAVGETLHAPHLIDLEVAQVLRRYVRSGDMGAARGSQAIDDLLDFPMLRYPHGILLPRIWQLRGGATAYDAAYLALAEALDAPVVTRDARLASVARHRAHVEVF